MRFMAFPGMSVTAEVPRALVLHGAPLQCSGQGHGERLGPLSKGSATVGEGCVLQLLTPVRSKRQSPHL